MKLIPTLQRVWAALRTSDDPTLVQTEINDTPVWPLSTPQGVQFVAPLWFTPGGGLVIPSFLNYDNDGIAVGPGLELLGTQSFLCALDDAAPTTADRLRSTDGSLHVTLKAAGARFILDDSPAANTQATATQAAPGAGLRNVIDSVSAIYIADTASTPAAVNVEILSAAVVIWSRRISYAGLAVGANVTLDLTGLQITAVENETVTVRFSAAGGAATFESFAATGYVETV